MTEMFESTGYDVVSAEGVNNIIKEMPAFGRGHRRKLRHLLGPAQWIQYRRRCASHTRRHDVLGRHPDAAAGRSHLRARRRPHPVAARRARSWSSTTRALRCPTTHPKLRELCQEDNIFVNPAWNLGAREATYDDLCFANDDIRFDVSLLADVRRILRMPVGIVAPHESSFVDPIGADESPVARRRLRVAPVYRRTNGFGTLMFMRRQSFVPIPDVLKVWFGDDYLFHHQRRRNLVFKGVPIHTVMGATSSSPEFTPLGLTETDAFKELARGDYEDRFRRDLQVARPLIRAAKTLRGKRR